MSNFLRDDGTFAAVSAQVSGPTSSVVNDFATWATTGGSQLNDTSPSSATSLLTAFTSSAQGVVPSSPGGTSNFIRADATWAVPPGSGTVVGPATSTIGDLATWASSIGTTLADTSWATATSKLTLATSSAQGAVPASGGGTANFLRADISWATPTGTLVLSTSATSDLPTAGSSNIGQCFLCTNSGVTTFLSTPTAGGTAGVPVFCDGTTWRLF